MDSWENSDLYELFGIEKTASIQEIKKAYRKKALHCHPDKNPNNPKANELFHKLSQALEILTDISARLMIKLLMQSIKQNYVLKNLIQDVRN